MVGSPRLKTSRVSATGEAPEPLVETNMKIMRRATKSGDEFGHTHGPLSGARRVENSGSNQVSDRTPWLMEGGNRPSLASHDDDEKMMEELERLIPINF